MDKEVKTVEEFNKACEEYFKYHLGRFSCGTNEYETCITGIVFRITEPEQFKDEDVRSLFTHNVCILDESLPLLGKLCKIRGDNRKGIFIGIEATEEDFYYMLKTDDGKVIFESCVGAIEIFKERRR